MSDVTREYLQNIGRYPLLTGLQEIQLSRKVRIYMELRKLEGERTPEEKRQIRAGIKARNAIVNANLRLVVHIAKRYTTRLRSSNMELMDLVQEGSFGLQRAAELFDPERGYKFSTYAYWWIRQALSRAIDTKERLVKVPQQTLDKFYKALRIEAQYMQENGCKPSKKVLAELVGITLEQLLALQDCSVTHQSLDVLITDDGNPLLDFIASPVAELYESDYDKEHLQLAMFYLTDKEQDLINKRYGLGPDEPEPLVLSKIAAQCSVSRERVRQRIDMACTKLKLMMQEYTFPPRAC
jgi:RNA polymerase sigma factor (sigma-70 family)